MHFTTKLFAGLIVCALTELTHAGSIATDPVTKLPLPAPDAPFSLDDGPNQINDVPVCKSKSTMNMYTGHSGKVSAAINWYSTHLVGFKHVHGFGSQRSQDTFFNTTGTLIVGITGAPGQDGQDTNLYSVIYGTIQPGVSDKVISGMNVQKVVCP